jgi:glycerate 2-kinase
MIVPSPDDNPLHAASRAVGPPPGTNLPAGDPAGDPAGFLISLFRTMVAAADPARLLPARLPALPVGRTVVIGAGKAAASMARAVEDHWPGDLAGLVVTRHGHALPCRRIEVVEAGHPLPDSSCSDAARRVLTLMQELSADDLVLVLLSGGGSSLLTLAAPGLTIGDVRETNRQLLRCGAPITAVNCVRKHLSAISGGRLAAAAWPAQMLTFAISDVPGDDPTVIASGPTVGDPSTHAQALEIADRYGLDLPPTVRRHLEAGHDETPKPGDPRLLSSRFELIATPGSALQAAAQAAREAGVEPLVLGADVQGEAREVAAEHAALVRDRSGPLLILSGGETAVTVGGQGRGGRNTEYLLALGLALEASRPAESRSVHALAADTDGIDGTEDNAGAVLFPDSLERARKAGLDPSDLLDANDSYGFFSALSALLVTGPTRTNVNDFRAILAL